MFDISLQGVMPLPSNGMSGSSMVAPQILTLPIEEMPDIVVPNAASTTQEAEIAAAEERRRQREEDHCDGGRQAVAV